jgi:sulfonate transport system substrate-binding protein
MKNKKIVLSVLIALVLLSLPFTSCSKSKKQTGELKTVRIGFPSSGSAWPGGIIGAAYEYGFLEQRLNEVGYTVELNSFVGAAPAIHEALVAKQLDYVVYAGMAADLSRANGIDHILISATSWGSIWLLVVGANSGIETINDLKGKKIAYTRGASPHMYLIRILREAGLTFDDIEPLNSTIPEGIAGVVTGSIDACIFSNGLEADLVAEGKVKVIHNGFRSDRNVFYEPFVFIARGDVYRQNRDVSVAIQKSFLQARDKAKEDVDAYYSLIAEKSSLPLNAVLATAEYDLDYAIPLSLDEPFIDSLKEILVFLQSNKLTSGNIDFDAWIDNKYVATRAAQEYANEKK